MVLNLKSPATGELALCAVVPVGTFRAVSNSLIVLLAGKVQNTSFVPALKSTALSLLVLERMVVLDKVSGEASVTVPMPTSNSAAVWCAIQ